MTDTPIAVSDAEKDRFTATLVTGDSAAAQKIAVFLAKSDLVPKDFRGKPESIVIAANMGARLGLDVFSSLAGIAVINGRATIWGDSMLAVCQQRSDWGGMSVRWEKDGEDRECIVTVRRLQLDGAMSEYEGRFSIEDAKCAGLWGKTGPWKQYPRRMVELRARSFALRGAFADALSGFHCREELQEAEPIRNRRQANAGVSIEDLSAENGGGDA